MLNEPPNRKPSENAPDQQIKLRIPLAQPAFTILLLFILVALFLARIPNTLPDDPILNQLGAQGSAILLGGQPYRLLTAQLLLEQPYRGSRLIVGIISLGISLYTLYIVGNGAERLWGHGRFAVIYFLGGIAGALVSLLVIPLNLMPIDVYFAAAPNAILAVLAGEVVYMYRHRNLWGLRGMQRRIFLVTLAFVNLLVGAFAPRVDLFGLIGGIIGGAVLAWFVAPLHMPRPHPDEPGALLGEDMNPLRRSWVVIAVYSTALVGLLALGVSLVR